MKTFETEKHNIPEGATHYRDEDCSYKFTWITLKGEGLYIWDGDFWGLRVAASHFYITVKPIPQTNIETPEGKEALDSIKPMHLRDYQKNTTPHQYESVASKEVEWVNGDKCIYQGKEWQFVSILSEYFHSTAVLFNVDTEELKQVPADSLSKETPQQREDRERAEAIYEMCSSVDNFTEESHFWAGKFYDAKYRKESK